MAASTNVAIGIDLGTTNSCVAVVRNGRVEVIANEQGHRTTPSVVAFTDTVQLIGDAAKSQASWNPENTVHETKRLIGRKFDNPSVQSGIKHWLFSVRNVEGNPRICVQYKREQKIFTPEEIAGMILSKMKEIAETYLGHSVKDAVITVPAYFNDSQRQATIDAGIIAGLNVLKIINEPTAAAIAYGVDKKVKEKRNVLVYDLGGGTFDVVVISVENGKFEVKAVNGNTQLGGGDFDTLLVDHFVKECQKKLGEDVSKNKKSMGKLRSACEQVKITLSSSDMEYIQIDSLYQGMDFKSLLLRGRFEQICSKLFASTIDLVKKVLKDSGINPNDIDEIVLAGGSTRIPKVQELLKNFFQGKTLNKTINPDEAVAYGAAIQAAMLSAENTVDEIFLTDVTPLSLGVCIQGDVMSTIIKRNSKIPTKVTHEYTTASSDYQRTINFGVYEGERKTASLNTVLGEFVAEEIEIAPMGVPKIYVTFRIDKNGILHATAVDGKTKGRSSVTINCAKGRLKKEEILKMTLGVQELRDQEARLQLNAKARNDLVKLVMDTTASAEGKNCDGELAQAELKTIVDQCNLALMWIEDHEEAGEGEYEALREKIERLSITGSLVQ